ncbi:hypothetical protein RKD18_000913 [Streptomyces phaeoluteigriseus]
MRAWPSGEACSRSGLHSRGSVTAGCASVSATATPCRPAASRMRALRATTRRGERPGEGGDAAHVGECHGGDAGALRRERGERGLQVTGDLVGVESGAQQVVHAGDDGGQVGAERERRGELLGAHLLGEPSADGEVGVPQGGVVAGESLGEAVRPPAQAGRVVTVAEPFRLAVAEGDVARVSDPGAGHGRPPASTSRAPPYSLF